MRKFTQLLLALSVSGTVLAASPHNVSRVNQFGNETRPRHNQRAKSVTAEQLKASGTYMLTPRKESGISIPGVDGEIITTPPDGEWFNQSRNCYVWEEAYGYVTKTWTNGFVQHMVETDDAVYVDLVASLSGPWFWIRGDKDAAGDIVFDRGQVVYRDEPYGELIAYAFIPLMFSLEGEHEQPVFRVADEPVKLLHKEDGTYVTEREDVMFAMYEWVVDKEGWRWAGIADSSIVISEVEDPDVEIPADAVTDEWTVIMGYEGWKCSVATTPDTVYVTGMISTNPDAVVTGEISADGTKVVFPGGQLLGVDYYETQWQYLYGGEVEMVYDERFEEWVYVGEITGDLVFDYDATARKMTSANEIIVALNKSDNLEAVEPNTFIEALKIEKQTRNPATPPMEPWGLSFEDGYEDAGESLFAFNQSYLDTDGVLLDAENLYFRMFVDGDVFTFYGDEYEGLPEDGTEIVNCDFSNMFSIDPSGISKWVFLYSQGVESLGVQSVYLQPTEDGTLELCSPVVTLDVSSVKTPVEGGVVSSTYYDLHGRRLAYPVSGICIRRDVMTDGSVRSVKTIVR